jgi:uncharacterized protein (DUF2236 family)
LQLLAIGMLPPSLRDAYGFEWRDRDQRALARWTKLLRAVLRLLPSFARRWWIGGAAVSAATPHPAR